MVIKRKQERTKRDKMKPKHSSKLLVATNEKPKRTETM